MELDQKPSINSNQNGNNSNPVTNTTPGSTLTTNNVATPTMTPNTSPVLKSSYDTDLVRLIGQYLVNRGFKQTANLLLEESGLQQIDHPLPIKFRDHILAGEWDIANQLVDDIANLAVSTDTPAHLAKQSPNALQTVIIKQENGCNKPTSTTNRSSNATNHKSDTEPHHASVIRVLRFAIAEQKFLELIDDNDRIRALRCLRCEITPLCQDIKRIQFLTTLLMCKSNKEIRLRANWSGKGQQTRQTLFDNIIRLIPPPIMLPPKRLETLLNQAVQLQRDRCVLHLRKLHPNQQHSTPVVENDRSNCQSIDSHQVSQFSKRASVSTIISGQDYLGCNGVCNQFESYQQLTYNDIYHGQRQHYIDNIPTMNCSEINGSCVNQTARFTKARLGENILEDHHPIDLKSDHSCSADKFPLQAKQELDSHKDEVWYCKFSNDGQKLATVGLGGKIKIWHLIPVSTSSSNDSTNTNNREAAVKRELVEKCTLDCSVSSVGFLSWSPNDAYLLACGCEDHPHLWIWDVNREDLRHTISQANDESTTTCAWHLSGERFAAASTKGTFNIYDLDGHRCGSRDGVRVNCVSFLHKDPNLILASDSLNRIKAYELNNETPTDILSLRSEEVEILEEKYSIMSFVVDREDKLLAVNIMEQGVHLWDLKHKALLRVFAGVCQRNLAIYSSFSSPDATFLASGSEDGRVYIYHIDKNEPVALLNGHLRCVNCVSWNPKYPELLASVSDDHTVRLWGPLELKRSYHLCRSLLCRNVGAEDSCSLRFSWYDDLYQRASTFSR